MRYAGQPPIYEKARLDSGTAREKVGDTDQVAQGAVNGANGRVAESLVKLVHDLLRDAAAGKVFPSGVERREAELRAGARDEDLVLGHMSGG